ncbi:hypothetical protein BS78_04G114300 [Paspalum vaginatum]|nr:hypothetical protein BS78_04G114300 [Paspalum vaginatum]
MFVCQKAGVNKKVKDADDVKNIVSQKKKRNNPLFACRIRCPARMIEDNHECVKKFSLTKYLASHRDIPPEEEDLLKFLHGCCITTTRAFQIMAKLYGGIENCPYTEGDTKNLRLEYCAEYRGKDVKATLEYFEELKKENPKFYHNYTLDEKAYKLYNDCISFDMTFLTNAYNMPCAPFIVQKINGWAGPREHITDQDIAIAVAIAEVFPETVHRNYRWHIMENTGKVLGPFLNNKKDLATDFNDCDDNNWMPHEFEHKWQLMLDKHEINDDERFRHLFDMGHRWVPAYFMLIFFLFLQTAARSEGFNVVLKNYVNPQNSILNFLYQYKKIQQKIFSKQLEHEAATMVKVPHYLTGHPIEVKMKEAYTRKLFNMFQSELQLSFSYYIVRVQEEELIDVVSYGTCPDKLYSSRTFWFASNKLDDGILCCHILKVFDALTVCEIPTHYILHRWSVEKLDDVENEEVTASPLESKEISNQGKHAIRYHTTCNKFSKIMRPFMIDDESHSIVLNHVDAIQHELAEYSRRRMMAKQGDANQNKGVNKKTKKTKKVDVQSNEVGPSGDATQPDLAGGSKNPPITKRQGWPRSKRYDGLKLRAKKSKPCEYCASTEHTTVHWPSKPPKKYTKEL